MQNALLAVDPGIRGSGAALFVGGRLAWADYVKNPARKGNRADAAGSMALAVVEWARARVATLDDLAAEWMQIYAGQIRAGASKGDPNDLLALTGVVSGVAAVVGVTATAYLPREWKGQLDKAAMHARIRGRLSEAELCNADCACRRAKSLAHNVMDAIGIGLFHLGRLERRRVFAGAAGTATGEET